MRGQTVDHNIAATTPPQPVPNTQGAVSVDAKSNIPPSASTPLSDHNRTDQGGHIQETGWTGREQLV